MHAGADGATAEGKKELIGFQTGMRESGQSWKELLVDLKARGLVVAPQVAIGDGALGFWKALDEAFPTTCHQRCWLHKTLNVLDKLPKSMQPTAHKDLQFFSARKPYIKIRNTHAIIIRPYSNITHIPRAPKGATRS